MRGPLRIAFAALAVSSAACSVILGIGDLPDQGNAGSDGSADSSTASDALTEGGNGDGGSGDAATTYASSLADSTLWEKFDTASLASTGGFLGGAFDGRYVYFVPNTHSTLVRYDTEGGFDDPASWHAHDLTSFGADFSGAIFAAPYLYLIPSSGTNDGTFVRFDTTADFSASGSYASFDLKAGVNANAHAFSPGAYDGKFAYLGPSTGLTLARFDTEATFDVDASYRSVKMSGATAYYTAGCFDGSKVYFAPAATTTGQPFGVVRQYATSADFTTPGSFISFDTSSDAGGVDPNAAGFQGCLFDGRYLYLEPYGINGANQGFASLVVRFDTTASFTSLGSYSKFDLKGVNSNAHGFHGSTFDGRYLYFAPFTKSTTVRFDTTLPGQFGDPSAWQPYDLTSTLDPNAYGYAGAVFDGEYVYYVPHTTTLAVRFHAKTPASLPSFRSSFY